MKPQFTIKSSADRKAEINIFGDIGLDWWTGEGNTVESITDRLAAINAIDADEVVVNINSLGGDLFQGIAIYDALKRFGDKLTVVLSGYCASAATVIAMAGKKRKMCKHDLILMHKCWGQCIGNENELEQELENQRKYNASMVQIYAETTGLSIQEIEDIMNENNGNGRWMDFDEALAKGFITGEAEAPAPNALYASASIVATRNLPALPEGYEADDEQRMIPFITSVVTKIFNNMSKSNEMAALDEQLQSANASLEAVNAQVSELNAKIEELTKANADIEADKAKAVEENAALQAKVAELQAIVDKIPTADTHVDGDDQPKEDAFASFVKESDFYAKAAEELQNR